MEAKKSFDDASTLGSKDRPKTEMDPSMLVMFLETCMKLLCDGKVVKGLQKLINRCTRTALGEPHIVQNLGNHKARTGREIRLTMQIGEYKMDQVILDLGLDVNVLPKQTWKRVGRLTLQWSPIHMHMVNQ